MCRTSSGWRRIEVHTVEQVVEHTLFDGELCGAFRRERKSERAFVEAFVEQAQAGPIEEQNLERIAALAEEQEQRAASRLARQSICHDTGEPIESPSQIDRLEPDEYFDAVRNHDRA